MVKLAYDIKMKSPKGPCVVVIHANWCGHCKTLIPKFENEIVTSDEFNSELEGLLTLGSIEEADYDNDIAKKIFGSIDGYPTIRYIYFSEDGKQLNSFDLPPKTPREPKDIIAWINDAVKNDVVKNDVVKNDVVKNDVIKNKTLRNSKKRMNGGGKKKKNKTTRKKNRKNKKIR
jgi:thioredoxin-like negative regulator of GroEL